jgi:hypothetical protein
MKYRVRLFRQLISLEHFEIDVDAESETDAIAAAQGVIAANPEHENIREGRLHDATAWKHGDVEQVA